MKPPPWAGDAPNCDHGKPRAYRSLFTKDGEVRHSFECVASEPGRCPAVWITPPKKGN